MPRSAWLYVLHHVKRSTKTENICSVKAKVFRHNNAVPCLVYFGFLLDSLFCVFCRWIQFFQKKKLVNDEHVQVNIESSLFYRRSFERRFTFDFLHLKSSHRRASFHHASFSIFSWLVERKVSWKRRKKYFVNKVLKEDINRLCMSKQHFT